MLATATVPAAPRPRPAATPRDPQPAERQCPYCCSTLAAAAKKCRICGEWVVSTSGGATAALLRVLGVVWGVLAVLAAAGAWYAGWMVRAWLVARAVDPLFTPLLLSVLLYAFVGVVLLVGLSVALGLGVLAGLAPRRPRWWT